CGSVLDPGGPGSGQCPAGQDWCADCSGGHFCSNGCPLYLRPPIDCASQPPEACDARTDCHSVFIDRQDCQCNGLGCCAQFLRCADGGVAKCSPGAIACDV